jgi:hypothetical protein
MQKAGFLWFSRGIGASSEKGLQHRQAAMNPRRNGRDGSVCDLGNFREPQFFLETQEKHFPVDWLSANPDEPLPSMSRPTGYPVPCRGRRDLALTANFPGAHQEAQTQK